VQVNKNGIPIAGFRVKNIPASCRNKSRQTGMKKSFQTQASAQKWLDKKFHVDFIGMEPYPCSIHGWHVGHSIRN